MPKGLILLVGEEKNTSNLGRLYLDRENFSVLTAEEDSKAFELITTRRPDLVVVDASQPGLDGLDLCRRLRRNDNQPPIVLITEVNQPQQMTAALEAGANEVVSAPVDPRELLARVKAVLRNRADLAETRNGSSDVLRVGDLEFDCARREVMCGHTLLDIRPLEFELLWQLALHRGLVVSRETLIRLVWGPQLSVQTRTVDMHIVRLRRLLKQSRAHIETVTGVGYKLVT